MIADMKLPKYLTPTSILFILRALGPQASARLLLSRLLSINHYYIVGKSLQGLVQQPGAAEEERQMTPLTKDDISELVGTLDALEPMDRRELLARIIFYNRGFENCYAIREGNEIAYLQWLVLPEENRLISESYSGIYYPLTAKQVMVENAFTFPRYRARGYFLVGTRQLLEMAKQKGYSSAIAYIRKDRIDPLNQFTQMGFKIIKLLTEYKVFGKAWKTF